MRLLNTSTYELEEFFGSNIPEYAILSHTWEEEEILFSDLRDESSRQNAKLKKGWDKVLGACERALYDGLEWVWIDTCCIDKQSSAELSEAINSMFSYYRDSFVCYAYLSDYHISITGFPDVHNAGRISLGDCRWFTRGWTLQELLAPFDLVFFDAEWEDMGTKYSLREAVSTITRIPPHVFVDKDITSFSIAARMSWAADRQTTREEDRAYSLMGIFGVNMPPLYGEGGAKAFLRLQEEILKYSDDHSLFAWHAAFDPQNPYFESRGLLAESPSEFRDSGDVCTSTKTGLLKSPYSMTNSGLRIHLPLRRAPSFPEKPSFLFTAQLCCQLGNNADSPVFLSVYLEKVEGEGYTSWHRWRPHCLLKDRVPFHDDDVREIYVKAIQTSHEHRLRPSKTLYSKSRKPHIALSLKMPSLQIRPNSREPYYDSKTGRWFIHYSLYDTNSPRSTHELRCALPGAADPMLLYIRDEVFWKVLANIQEPNNELAERERLQPYFRDQMPLSFHERDEKAMISLRKLLVQTSLAGALLPAVEVGCRLEIRSIQRVQEASTGGQSHRSLQQSVSRNDPKILVIPFRLRCSELYGVTVLTTQWDFASSPNWPALSWTTECDWHSDPARRYYNGVSLTLTSKPAALLCILEVEKNTQAQRWGEERRIAVILEIVQMVVVWHEAFSVKHQGDDQTQILREAERFWRARRQSAHPETRREKREEFRLSNLELTTLKYENFPVLQIDTVKEWTLGQDTVRIGLEYSPSLNEPAYNLKQVVIG
ncbi:hypothetical protein D9758_008343 [Tetrapyrgos nigripes]|uniref:Heterokaryon incompatibility domain-containing protein n=1 Tax=Tetrapyrgos nigripes TaxID=182062 RepID=A0A8H5LN00_9AGAR|nr:hypothetical protein D9758_008343 [Tetrapyrgos nigripes]